MLARTRSEMIGWPFRPTSVADREISVVGTVHPIQGTADTDVYVVCKTSNSSGSEVRVYVNRSLRRVPERSVWRTTCNYIPIFVAESFGGCMTQAVGGEKHTKGIYA